MQASALAAPNILDLSMVAHLRHSLVVSWGARPWPAPGWRGWRAPVVLSKTRSYSCSDSSLRIWLPRPRPLGASHHCGSIELFFICLTQRRLINHDSVFSAERHPPAALVWIYTLLPFTPCLKVPDVLSARVTRTAAPKQPPQKIPLVTRLLRASRRSAHRISTTCSICRQPQQQRVASCDFSARQRCE